MSGNANVDADGDATRRLAAVGRRVDPTDLPPDVMLVAKHCILDWLGVTLAGAREPVVKILVESACAADGGDEAALLGLGARSSLLGAALVHGTAAHALDYDDTHWGLQGHPSAPVLGALWGLSERERLSGSRLLAAFVAGVEVECTLGRWLNPEHYARGFHATGTLGTFGAAAAAAHALGLPEPAWLNAFGLAGTQAAGLKSGFGSMAKPLHAGRAAHAGLMSALLAAGGFTANPSILEDPQGFAATHGSSTFAGAPRDSHEILETLFKYHATCHLTHATIEGLRELAQAHQFAASDVARVELSVDETCLGVCAIERPATGMQAKFSLKMCAAMALLGDRTEDPSTFSDARANAREVRELAERVAVRVKPMAATHTEISVQLSDGRALAIAHDSGTPERDLARQTGRLVRKFEAVAPLSAANRAAVTAWVMTLDAQADLRGLYALLARSA